MENYAVLLISLKWVKWQFEKLNTKQNCIWGNCNCGLFEKREKAEANSQVVWLPAALSIVIKVWRQARWNQGNVPGSRRVNGYIQAALTRERGRGHPTTEAAIIDGLSQSDSCCGQAVYHAKLEESSLVHSPRMQQASRPAISAHNPRRGYRGGSGASQKLPK